MCIIDSLESVRFPEEVKVVAGTIHLEHTKSSRSEHWIEEVIYHPEYSELGYINDIALIRIKGQFNLNNSGGSINTICLPTTHNLGRYVIAAGWGKTLNGDTSNVLRTVRIEVVNQKSCKNFYRHFQIKESMFCAGKEIHEDVCHVSCYDAILITIFLNLVFKP